MPLDLANQHALGEVGEPRAAPPSRHWRSTRAPAG